MIVGLPITNEMEHESIQARRYSCAIPTGKYTQSHIDSNRPQSTRLAAATHPSSSIYVSNRKQTVSICDHLNAVTAAAIERDEMTVKRDVTSYMRRCCKQAYRQDV